MATYSSRRDLLKFAATMVPLQLAPLAFTQTMEPSAQPLPDSFPTQPPELVREMVTVAHFNLQRVRELVERHSSLARAAWDWGFGDWEDALGAASHMGNRPIAEFLLSKGARPTLFSAAMLGQLDVVKALVAGQPGAQRIRGPHSISLLAHAKAGGSGARSVYDFLQSLGDAGSDSEAPLSEADKSRILGTYIFGIGSSQQIDVTMEHNPFNNTDQLTWTRKGMMGRPIYHLGSLTFYPAGAPDVRIRFTSDSSGATMIILDPDPVLTVRRKPPAK